MQNISFYIAMVADGTRTKLVGGALFGISAFKVPVFLKRAAQSLFHKHYTQNVETEPNMFSTSTYTVFNKVSTNNFSITTNSVLQHGFHYHISFSPSKSMLLLRIFCHPLTLFLLLIRLLHFYSAPTINIVL